MTLSSPIEIWNTALFDNGPVAKIIECENRFEIVTHGDLDDCTKEALRVALEDWMDSK